MKAMLHNGQVVVLDGMREAYIDHDNIHIDYVTGDPVIVNVDKKPGNMTAEEILDAIYRVIIK